MYLAHCDRQLWRDKTCAYLAHRELESDITVIVVINIIFELDGAPAGMTRPYSKSAVTELLVESLLDTGVSQHAKAEHPVVCSDLSMGKLAGCAATSCGISTLPQTGSEV